MHAIEREGRLPAVVCVHGYCQSAAYWEPTLERLAQFGARGIAVDLPGFAHSAKNPGPYTMEGLADALARFLDGLKLASVVLVGGSMGGVVAQHFALRHPGRVLRLLLVATGAYTADPEGALAKADALAAASWDKDVITPIINGFFWRTPPEPDLARLRQIAAMTTQGAAIEAARSNARSRTLERLSEIHVPTLIIQGRYDRVRTPEHGAEMRDRIRGARLEVLEASGHTPHLEEPETFLRIALPFLLAGRCARA
jgi:3-oxoadipate enol-lactonase